MDDEVEKSRTAANAAFREMYAKPGPDAREAWRNASNAYCRIRAKKDPDF
jgi:hypothetical protein